MHHIACSEIWGGARDEDLDACTRGIVASLHSSASNGRKGGHERLLKRPVDPRESGPDLDSRSSSIPVPVTQNPEPGVLFFRLNSRSA